MPDRAGGGSSFHAYPSYPPSPPSHSASLIFSSLLSFFTCRQSAVPTRPNYVHLSLQIVVAVPVNIGNGTLPRGVRIAEELRAPTNTDTAVR